MAALLAISPWGWLGQGLGVRGVKKEGRGLGRLREELGGGGLGRICAGLGTA